MMNAQTMDAARIFHTSTASEYVGHVINVSSNVTSVSGTSAEIYERHGFINDNPAYAIPCLVLLAMAGIVGTFGNIMILVLIFTKKSLQGVETTFQVNLAISDLYVTLIADPMSFVAKIEGEGFFDRVPGLCQTVASMCTISCVTSLMTIAVMSINRYFYICANEMYEKLFTKWNCVCICFSLYFIGGTLVLLNALGVGDHGFDRKSLECIWDRMATFYYTVVFSIALVWLPSIVTGACYLRIYLYVKKHRRRIEQQTQNTTPSVRNSHLAKTLFLIYAVFITCWAPYALLIVIDSENTYPHELHVYITVFAHLHPSLNWLIYYITNKNFAEAYKQLLRRCISYRTTNSSSVMGLPVARKRTVSQVKPSQTSHRNEHRLETLPVPAVNTALTVLTGSNRQINNNGDCEVNEVHETDM